MQHKSITINTNDPDNQTIRVKMVGYVKLPAAKDKK
jgi:hypothetical protein